jgi:hypothetical protein
VYPPVPFDEPEDGDDGPVGLTAVLGPDVCVELPLGKVAF